MRGLGIVLLGADGVGLALHLLQEELHPPTMRTPLLDEVTELSEMACHPRGLFRDIRTLSQDCNLLFKPPGIDRFSIQQALEPKLQTTLVALHDFRRAGG